MDDSRKSALAGVKVLDLSRFIAGPVCAMYLGDLGADVIKVEGARGDENRHFAPMVDGRSIQQMAFNRNKRACIVDSRSAQGRADLLALADWADIIVENFRPGVLDAMGLGYETVSQRKPGIIVTSVSGFGQTSPYRDRPLFDPIAQAMSGLMYVNATQDGEPKLTGTFFGDHLAGLVSALGTLAALNERHVSGRGQHVDVSVFDSLLAALGPGLATFVLSGQRLPTQGNRDPYSAPATLFNASDGAVYIHAGTQGLFPRLCALLERTDLVDDERFATVADRMEHVREIEDIVSDWVSTQTCAEVDARLTAVGVPCGIVADVDTVSADPHVRARNMLVQVDDTTGAPTAFLANPVKLSATPVAYRLAPPRLGEHNDEVAELLAQLRGEQP